MCVIFYMNINGQLILAKNRDLPYNPSIDIVHEIVNGTEVVYMRDKNNGWIEGINEHGTGMVNSSLLEDFHHYPGYNMHKNKMYSTLTKNHMNKRTFFGELLKKSDNKYILEGHTLIAHDNHMYHLENSSLNKHVLTPLSAQQKYKVFSNHGIHLPNEGLTDGRGGVSSFLRRELTKTEIDDYFKHTSSVKCDDNKLYDELSSLLNKNYVNVEYRFHPYRKKSKIMNNTVIVYTSAQLILNITNKEFIYFKDTNYSENVKYINKLPNHYVPKIRVMIKETEKSMRPVKRLTQQYLQKIYKRFNYTEKLTKSKSTKSNKNKTRKNKK